MHRFSAAWGLGRVWQVRRTFLINAALLCAVLAPWGPAAWAATGSADALLAKRTELTAHLQAREFGEPLYLVSHDSGHRADGDVYAELALPFARVRAVLSTPQSICGVLFLHLNIRSCSPSSGGAGDLLTLSVGPKQSSSLGARYSMAYAMQVAAASPGYLHVNLAAQTGPLMTDDYRIVFEATPLDEQHTFLHFGYAYSYGTLARLAMQAYLATAGRSKIGFTVLGVGADGQPLYVQGERGALERNVIRNYLALLAYASIEAGTPQAQTEVRLRAWFALTERHAAQLHELGLDDYLQEKHLDLAAMSDHAP